MRHVLVAAASAALLWAPGATAHPESCGCPAESHWAWNPAGYAGAAVAMASFSDWNIFSVIPNDGSLAPPNEDDAAVGFRIFGGIEFLEYGALELGYADFGEASVSTRSDGSGTQWNAGPISQRLSLDALDLSLLGKLPLAGGVSLRGRLGAIHTRADESFSGSIQGSGPLQLAGSDKNGTVVLGLGLEYVAHGLVVSVEASRFELGSSAIAPVTRGRVDTLSAAVAYRF
jgi:hypothetical protein